MKELELGLCNFLLNRASETYDAVGRCLESSTSRRESFKVTFRSLVSEEDFRPIAQGLINSESVTAITFDRCNFSDDGTTHLLRSIFQSKTNIHSLRVEGGYVCEGELSFENVINLLLPDAPLLSLELSRVYFPEFGISSLVEFKTLLKAVEKSQLECFTIGRIREQAMCRRSC